MADILLLLPLLLLLWLLPLWLLVLLQSLCYYHHYYCYHDCYYNYHYSCCYTTTGTPICWLLILLLLLLHGLQLPVWADIINTITVTTIDAPTTTAESFLITTILCLVLLPLLPLSNTTLGYQYQHKYFYSRFIAAEVLLRTTFARYQAAMESAKIVLFISHSQV